MSKKIKTSSGLQGITRLITDATIGVTNLVEDMHHQIVHPPFLPSTPIQHLITDISGLSYKQIRWSSRLIGRSLDRLLGLLGPLLNDSNPSEQAQAIHSALNGLCGDYLESKENPLAIKMHFRHQSSTFPLERDSLKAACPDLSGKILLMVHGSCMNDAQWTRKDHNHGLRLAEALNHSAVFLQYNSGRHISSNGKTLQDLLEKLIQAWPVPVEELSIIGHSMGGLVARSAVYYGQQNRQSWIKLLKKMIFLGTPHHGAPLEQIGSYLDVFLESIPYTKPLARLAKIRSAGVTDLRYGNLIEEDWQNQASNELPKDHRCPIPLPTGIDCYSIAAVIGQASDSISSKIIGDRLVAIDSALGRHKDPAKQLSFKDENTWIAEDCSHLDLLNKPEVYTSLKSWLT